MVQYLLKGRNEMKKLVLGLALVFAANAALAMVYYNVQIDELWYHLDDSTKTAEVASHGFPTSYSMTSVEIPASVTYEGQDYAVDSIGQEAFSGCASLESVCAPSIRSIGQEAFNGCVSLKSVYAPLLTSIGQSAFSRCSSLTSLTVNSAMKEDWLSKALEYYDVWPSCNVIFDPTPIPKLTLKQVAQAGYEVKEAEVETTVSVKVVADPSVTLKSNGQEISEEDYANACIFYGIGKKDRPDVPSTPTAEDYKIVSKDAQVVQEGEIAVKKESIAAAKAMTVQIVNGQIELSVSASTNADITAEVPWAPVKFTPDTQIGLSSDGTKLILPIPVAAQQGFMILQSGDAKAVPSNGAKQGFYKLEAR